MTINRFLNSLPNVNGNGAESLRDVLADSVHIWSNDACIGYLVYAMCDADFNREQILKVISCMRDVFNDVSVPDAEQIYIEF